MLIKNDVSHVHVQYPLGKETKLAYYDKLSSTGAMSIWLFIICVGGEL